MSKVGDWWGFEGFVEVVLEDEEVGDGDGVVVVEVAFDPGFAGLVEVVLEGEEIGDGDLAVHGGVAGEGVFEEEVGGVEGLPVEGGITCVGLVLGTGGVSEGFDGGGGERVFGGGGGDS